MQHKRCKGGGCSLGFIFCFVLFFNYLLGKTLTNVQSSHSDLSHQGAFLIIWFNCECRIGGRGEKNKTLELDDIEKNKNTIVTNKECRLQKQKKATAPQKNKI